nr:MAG TPA: hypothetical protein [Caudoviricetes sp.]
MTLPTYSANRGQDEAKVQRITANGREFSLPFFFVSKYQENACPSATNYVTL